ncbi:MAG: hypothetical protein NZ889_01690 [Candidatus Pacearchaeota archaeon]|nr:hypothetical protein [Candidatus Pacearchaeota archaeon]
MKRGFLSQRLGNQCFIGLQGKCCKNCLLGPCIVVKNSEKGACGASQDLVVARNLLRFAAAGAAAHCGHAFHMLDYLKKECPEDYIKRRAPVYLYEKWKKLGLLPKKETEYFKEISEALHLTTFGCNADYEDVLRWCIKMGVLDGYYGLYLATELEDKIFGKPSVRIGELNLGVIKPEKVNIALHGHEQIFAEAITREVKRKDNEDINLIGVCCTGASLLARHGIPLAANVVLQEQVIATGCVDVLVVDVQCIMPSLADLAECYHTKIVTTNEICRIPNALHFPIKNKRDAEQAARQIIRTARILFKHRKRKEFVTKPEKKRAVVGFHEKNLPFEIKKLAEKIKERKIKGIIAVIGCENPRVKEDWIRVYKELSKEYIFFTTGCMAFKLAQFGLLDGKRFFHMGSCVNNARIAEVFKEVSRVAKHEIHEMPFLVSCPMPITEKAIAIGMFFASLGVDVHFGYNFLVSGDLNIANSIASFLKKEFKSKVFLEMLPRRFMERIEKEGLATIYK